MRKTNRKLMAGAIGAGIIGAGIIGAGAVAGGLTDPPLLPGLEEIAERIRQGQESQPPMQPPAQPPEEEEKGGQEPVYTGQGYTISISQEDMFGSDNEEDETSELIPEIARTALEDLPPEIAEVGRERLGELVQVRDDIVAQVPEARDSPGFSNWVMQQVIRLSAAGVSLEGLKKLIETGTSIYERWKNGKTTWVSTDGVGILPPDDSGKNPPILPPFKNPPPKDNPQSKNEERAIYFSMPTKPHCKRHVYVDGAGVLRSLLVCSDTEGTRTYHDA